MQHLSRNTDESIMIGDDIEITVFEASNGCVKFAINAPDGTAIHESEVYVRLERSKHLAVVKSV